MENEQRKYWFFGSKLNTALLLILIILMVVAIRFMLQNKETYLPVLSDKSIQSAETQTSQNLRTGPVLTSYSTVDFSFDYDSTAKIDKNNQPMYKGTTTQISKGQDWVQVNFLSDTAVSTFNINPPFTGTVVVNEKTLNYKDVKTVSGDTRSYVYRKGNKALIVLSLKDKFQLIDLGSLEIN